MNYSYTFDHIFSYEEFVDHLQTLLDNETNYVHFCYTREAAMQLSMKMCYQTYVEEVKN